MQNRSKTNGVSPKQAAARLRKAGFRIAPGKGKAFKPLDVKGLDLSRALDEARGKSRGR